MNRQSKACAERSECIANQQSPIRRQSASDNRQSAIRPTDRQRAAARRNLVKAQSAWLQLLRDPNFSLSSETLLRIWQGLVNAVRWHLTDCSARYASNFRDGIFAISLVRSLAAAGELLADYVRHVRQIVWAFTGHDEFVDRSSLIVAHNPDPLGKNQEPRSTNNDLRSRINDPRSTDKGPGTPLPNRHLSTPTRVILPERERNHEHNRRSHGQNPKRVYVSQSRRLADQSAINPTVGLTRSPRYLQSGRG